MQFKRVDSSVCGDSVEIYERRRELRLSSVSALLSITFSPLTLPLSWLLSFIGEYGGEGGQKDCETVCSCTFTESVCAYVHTPCLAAAWVGWEQEQECQKRILHTNRMTSPYKCFSFPALRRSEVQR